MAADAMGFELRWRCRGGDMSGARFLYTLFMGMRPAMGIWPPTRWALNCSGVAEAAT